MVFTQKIAKTWAHFRDKFIFTSTFVKLYDDEVRKYRYRKRLKLLTSTLTTRLSLPSLWKEWGCPLSSNDLSPILRIRVQRSCSIVTKALLICAYLETRNVAKCRANRSGLRIWGEIFARSEQELIPGIRDREIYTYNTWYSWLKGTWWVPRLELRDRSH